MDCALCNVFLYSVIVALWDNRYNILTYMYAISGTRNLNIIQVIIYQ